MNQHKMRKFQGILGKAATFILAICAATSANAEPSFKECTPFRWVTLGTAGGPIPTIDRSEPANLLVAGDQTLLVDTGDGTVGQMARAGINLGQITGVFISHAHLDHTGGLAAVIGLRWMNQHSGVLVIYGPRGTKDIVDGIIASMRTQARVGFGVGVASQPPADSVRVVELTGGQAINLGNLKVITAINSHFDHSGPQHADAPESFSYRFSLGDRSVTYTGDTGPSAAVTRLAAGSDILVSEVIEVGSMVQSILQARPDLNVQAQLQMQQHLSSHHLRPEDVGQMAADANVGRIVLTHFAVPAGPLARFEESLRSGIAIAFKGPVDLARDLSSFDIGCEVK